MVNLTLIDKLIFIVEKANDYYSSTGDQESIEKIWIYEEELIKELEKDNTIYELNYWQDAHRTYEYWDITYYNSIESLQQKLKTLLLEDDNIEDILEASVIWDECNSIEYFDWNNNNWQYELSNWSNSVYFEISTLLIN